MDQEGQVSMQICVWFLMANNMVTAEGSVMNGHIRLATQDYNAKQEMHLQTVYRDTTLTFLTTILFKKVCYCIPGSS